MANPIALIKKQAHIAAAVLIGVALVLPIVLNATSEAAQIQTRSLQLSNSATGATGVSYKATFNAATTSTVKGFAIDICSGNSSPLLGTTCTAITAGFSWNTPAFGDVTTFTVNGVAQTVAAAPTAAQWGVGTVNSGRTLTLASVNGVAITAGQTVVIEVANVNNPSDVHTVTAGNQVGTFYGRLASFPNDTGASSPINYTDAYGETDLTDFGGTALSTTNNLLVTARVQESITFCVYTSGAGATCATGTGSAIDIPDATTALNNSTLSTNDAYFSVGSNALNGVDIRMWSADAVYDGVLKSGANTITAIGVGDDTACTTVNASLEQFGMQITEGTGVIAEAPYDGVAGCYGWDASVTSDATKVGSTYGDIIASTAGATDEDDSVMEFAAKANITSEAGIYTTSLNYIATGTY